MSFEYYFEKHDHAKKRLQLTTIFFQLITCVVLTVAVLRIRKIVNQVKGLDIKMGRLLLHLASFWLYFVSYTIYYSLYLQSHRSGYIFVLALLVTVITETISVVILTYIIWEIYLISLAHAAEY
jgi:hypothetical protein